MLPGLIYDKLITSDHIRLLTLLPGEGEADVHISLRQQVELPVDGYDYDDGPEYTALSYMWGPPHDTSPIWINGARKPVRTNLLKALRALRDPEGLLVLWVDAICINQDDLHEKNKQVAAMARIYRGADQVKVWLGPAEGHSDLVVDFARAIGQDETAAITLFKDMLPLVAHACDSMLERTYWTRAWIVQELMLAKMITLHCGLSVVRWNDFVRSCDILRPHLSLHSSRLLIERRTQVIDDPSLLLSQTLESLIRAHHNTECLDPRDRVFAFLSLASDCAFGCGLRPDYRMHRFDLLVQVLDCCNPADPANFISLLFKVLALQGEDKLWQKAASVWKSICSGAPVFDENSAMNVISAGHEIVRITHFVTASSLVHDWVRVSSLDAILDSTRLSESGDENDVKASPPLCNELMVGFTSSSKSRLIKVGDTRFLVVLQNSHLVVLSGTSKTAPICPCAILQLHKTVTTCSAMSCGKLESLRSDKD